MSLQKLKEIACDFLGALRKSKYSFKSKISHLYFNLEKQNIKSCQEIKHWLKEDYRLQRIKYLIHLIKAQ